MKKVSIVAAAVISTLAIGAAHADDKVQQGWQLAANSRLTKTVPRE